MPERFAKLLLSIISSKVKYLRPFNCGFYFTFYTVKRGVKSMIHV